MGRNYLKGFVGDIKNALLAVMDFNIRRWIRKVFLLYLDVIKEVIAMDKSKENQTTKFCSLYYNSDFLMVD